MVYYQIRCERWAVTGETQSSMEFGHPAELDQDLEFLSIICTRDQAMNQILSKILDQLYVLAYQPWVRDIALLVAISGISYLPGLFTSRALRGYRESARVTESRSLKISLELLDVSFWPLWAILFYSIFGLWIRISKTAGHPLELIPILLFFLLYRLLISLTKEFLPMGRRRRRIRRVIIPIVFVLVILQQLGLLGDITKWLGHPFFKFGATGISVFSILLAVALVAAFVTGARILSDLLGSRILPGIGIDPTTSTSLGTLVRYCLVVVGFFVGLSSLGFDLSTLKIVLGALGVGVGFGLQNVVNNFASGLIILIERKVKQGDIVRVGETDARVVTIGLRSSVVHTRAGHDIIIPNSDLVGSQVTNFSYRDRFVRVDIPVGVSYASDPDQVRDILLDAAKEESRVLEQPAPDVLFRQYGNSSIDFELRVWIDEPWVFPSVRSALYFNIWYRLKKANIEIPFPQRDLHVRSGELRVRMTSKEGPEKQ
jgi:small-conductance mechanosensitive channel